MSAPAPPKPQIVRQTAVQIASYAGAAAAIVAAAVIVGRREIVSRTLIETVVGVIAGALLVAGFAIERRSPEAYQRMRSAFWFGSAVAFAAFMAIVVLEGLGARSLKSTALEIEVTSGIYSAVLYVLHRRLLQQVLAFQAAVGLVVALTFPEPSTFFFGPPDLTGTAVLVWVLSAAWLFLGCRGALQPKRTAMVLGSLGLLGSTLFLTRDQSTAELLLFVTSCGLIAVATWADDWLVGGIGAAGLILDTGVIVRRHLVSTDSSSVTTLVVGVVLLAAALIVIRTSGSAQPETPPSETPPSETPPSETPPSPPMPQSEE